MLENIKKLISKHFGALQNPETRENEKQALGNSITGLLSGIFRAVIIIGICYVILAPVIGIVANSFFSTKDIYNPMVYLIPQTPTLERYQTDITVLNYGTTMWRSLAYSLSLLVFQVVTCSMVGYGFARFQFPLKSLLFGCVVVMIVVPTHTIMLPLYMTFRNFDPLGLVSAINSIFGTQINTNMMKSSLPVYILTIFGCCLRSGLYIYIFNQFFRGLPKEMEEAAFMDGAGTWYTYFFIMLRNAMPAVITVAVFSMVWQYNDTFYAKLFQIPQSQNIALRMSSLIANVANLYKVYDINVQNLYLDAGIVLMLIPIVLIYVVLQKQFIEGVERSGIVG